MDTTDPTTETNVQPPDRRSTAASRRAFLKAAGAGALATGLAGLTGSGAADEHEVGIPTPWLDVDGNLLRDPDGNKVVLRGVNTIDPKRANEEAPYNTMFVADQLELMSNPEEGWYTRLVRLPMQPQDIGGHSPGTAADPVAFTEEQLEAYLEEHIDPAVEKCRERGMYVIVDYHRHYPEGPDWDEPDLDEEIRLFWEVVAPRYADQSHVLYELYNEPTTPYPGAGDPTDDVGVISERAEENYLYWRETAQPWVDLIREYAERNVIIIGSPRWTQFTYWADEHEFEGENLAYAGHVYTHENLRPLGDLFGKPSENVPVFMTEFGFQPYEGAPYLTGTRDEHGAEFYEFYEEYDSVHWTAWCFDFEWDPEILDRNYEVGNEWGQWVQDYLYEKRNDDVPGVADSRLSAPSGLQPTEVTTSSIALEWNAVAAADSYRVFVGDEAVDRVTNPEATIDDLEAGTAYDVGVSSVADDEESTVTTLEIETRSASGPGEPPEIDGYEPADTTGDGLYNDITGSGSTTTTDVTVFFENVEDPSVSEYPQYYDFDGSGQVSISDVIELFESL